MNERLLELEGQGVTGQGPMEGVKSMGGIKAWGPKRERNSKGGKGAHQSIPWNCFFCLVLKFGVKMQLIITA